MGRRRKRVASEKSNGDHDGRDKVAGVGEQEVKDEDGVGATKKAKNEAAAKSDALLKAKVLSWNVNGIRAALKKEGKLQALIDEETPDVVCLQETKIDESIKAEFEDILGAGWHATFACAEKKGYSGTATFSRALPVSSTVGIGSKEHDSEGRVITTDLGAYVVVNVYVPNSGLKLERLDYRTTKWDPAFRSYLADLRSKGKPVLVVGDFNVAHSDIDVQDPKTKRNKTPGMCDAERENFGFLVGGDGPIPEAARTKRTTLIGRPGPVEPDAHDGWIDCFRHLHGDANGGDAPDKATDGGDAAPVGKLPRRWTFWGFRFAGKEKDRGWRLDYCLATPEVAGCLRGVYTREDVYGVSDHVPLVVVADPLALDQQ